MNRFQYRRILKTALIVWAVFGIGSCNIEDFRKILDDLKFNEDRIVFTSERAGTGNRSVYTMNPDGSDVRRITFGTTDCKQPDWAPGKLQILYSRDGGGGNWNICAVSSDGSGDTALTTGENDIWPEWSDGNNLLLIDRYISRNNLYTMNPDGSGITEIQADATERATPHWHPDGQRITYMARGSTYQIFTADRFLANETSLTSNGENRNPVWSPDGNQILFQSNRDGAYGIYVMNADGTGQTPLTDNSAVDQAPDWSPDGTRIVFSSDRNGNFDIYTMNTDGSVVVRLSDAAGTDSTPVWK